MWIKGSLILIGVFVALTVATETSSRPKPCPVGSTYKKDCNTCTCASVPSKDKCGQVNCKRTSGTRTTPAPGGPRPGTCPTVVTPAPGSNVCQNRTRKSTCTEDKNCPQAKKCCRDGCNVYSCRNAIYRYTK